MQELANLGVSSDIIILMAILTGGMFFSVLILSGLKYAVISAITSVIAAIVTIFMIVATNTAGGMYPGLAEFKAITQMIAAVVIWAGLTWLGQKM